MYQLALPLMHYSLVLPVGIISSSVPVSSSPSTINPPGILSNPPSAQVGSLPATSFEAILSDPPLAPVISLPAISPSPSTELLPFTPSLTSMCFELESEIERLSKEFENLVNSLEKYLLEKKVSVGKLQRAIKNIPISLKHLLGEYFRQQTSSIFKTESIPELMLQLSYFWDYFNPGLLAFFVGKYGSKDNIGSKDAYIKELEEFRMRVKVGEYLQVTR